MAVALMIENLSRELAEFTVRFKLKDAPGNAIANAKIAILDCLGVALLAGTSEIGDAIRSYASAAVASGRCTVWGTKLSAGIRDAAFLNGMLAHGLDYDDSGHSTTYLLASSFAATEGEEQSGARLLEAFIVGREVRYSLNPIFANRHAGVGPGARGWHATGILGGIAAACAASRVFGLSANQTAHAIGLGAGSCGALTRDGGTMAKSFRTGQAGATGLTAAQLAQSGFSSDEQPLEGRLGLLQAIGPIPEDTLAKLGDGLGKVFSLESEVDVKLIAACAAAHAPVEAMLRLRNQHNIRPDRVARIDCDLKLNTAIREFPQRGYEGHFSVRFCIAMALANGHLHPNDFSDSNVANPTIKKIMQVTRHVSQSAEIAVTLSDGTCLVTPIKPATKLTQWHEVEDKFRQCAAGIISEANADTVIRHIDALETLTNIDAFATSLRPN